MKGKIKKFKNGLTIKELKDYVKDLKERNEYGEEYTVWISTEKYLSSPVVEIIPLNLRENGSDILFEPKEYYQK